MSASCGGGARSSPAPSPSRSRPSTARSSSSAWPAVTRMTPETSSTRAARAGVDLQRPRGGRSATPCGPGRRASPGRCGPARPVAPARPAARSASAASARSRSDRTRSWRCGHRGRRPPPPGCEEPSHQRRDRQLPGVDPLGHGEGHHRRAADGRQRQGRPPGGGEGVQRHHRRDRVGRQCHCGHVHGGHLDGPGGPPPQRQAADQPGRHRQRARERRPRVGPVRSRRGSGTRSGRWRPRSPTGCRSARGTMPSRSP